MKNNRTVKKTKKVTNPMSSSMNSRQISSQTDALVMKLVIFSITGLVIMIFLVCTYDSSSNNSQHRSSDSVISPINLHHQQLRQKHEILQQQQERPVHRQLNDDDDDDNVENNNKNNKEVSDGNDDSDDSDDNDDNSNSNEPEYYMIFSTGCSAFQDWQSYSFFYFAMKVKQRGQVIRIASGCDEDQADALKKVHDEQISIMSPNFHLHITPDFSGPDHYKYYNKPFGLKHWMENYLNYPSDSQKHDNAIVMLLDPDQILLRPMVHDFTNQKVIYHKPPGKNKDFTPLATKAQHGIPFASVYGFGSQPFTKINLTAVAGEDSLVHKTTSEERIHNYPAGPPYMATAKDMYAIALKWTEFVPKVHEQYKGLLGEMFAFCLAAAHLGLKHQLMDSFMISDVHINRGEGWKLLEDTIFNEDDGKDICTYPPNEDNMPSVMHFCQNYFLGKWFIGKYRLDSDFLSCKHPLMTIPPPDIHTKYDFAIKPGSKPYGDHTKLQPDAIKRNAWVLCYLIPAINEVGKWYKDHHCSAEEEGANYEETHVFHYSMDVNDNSGGEKKPRHW